MDSKSNLIGPTCVKNELSLLSKGFAKAGIGRWMDFERERERERERFLH